MIINDFNKTALIDGEIEITYAELIEHVREYAALIDIEPGERVVILAENRLEWIYALYAIWNHGGIAVPLDFAMREETLRTVLADCRPSVICTSALGAAKLDRASSRRGQDRPGAKLIDFDALERPAGALPPLRTQLNPDDTALIVYTSGTTGPPKGVMLSYTNLMATINGLIDFDIMRREDRVIGLLPFHHIYPLQGTIILPLYVGATVVYVHELNSAEILRVLKQHRITFFIGVPRLYELFHRNIFARINASAAARTLLRLARRVDNLTFSRVLFGRIHTMFGGQVRLYASGGSKLDAALARDMRDLGFVLDEGYGVSETAPIIAFNPFDRIRLGSVGLPLPGTQVTIHDGEILTRGPHVMQGYFNKPQETESKIHDGWYHTGDAGYLDEDGYLYVTGRKDDMIVLPSGKNINPEDIERDILAISPLIEDIGVMQRDGKLAALIYPNYALFKKEKIANIVDAIRRTVIDRYNSGVEGYRKILEIAILREPLPKTNLGKLQRFLMDSVLTYGERRPRDIPEPEIREYALLKDFLEQQTGRPILPDDHFDLDVGLDSLARVELQVYVESTFGLELADEDLAHHPTVQSLAEFVRAGQTRAEDSQVDWKEIFSRDVACALPPMNSLTLRIMRAVLRPLGRAWFQVRTSGMHKLPSAPFILAPNHQSYLDAVLLIAFLPWEVIAQTCIVAKQQPFYTTTLGRWLIERMHVIVLDGDKDLKASLQAIATVLQQGRNVAIFPEGTRSRDGSLAPFKKLFAILSTELDLMVVPLAIQGAFEALPRGSLCPRHAPIALAVCDPIRPDGKDYDQLRIRVQCAIEDHLQERS